MDNAQNGGASISPCQQQFILHDQYKRVFDLKRASRKEERETAYRLRYQIYCLENRFEDPRRFPDALERDLLDDQAQHALVTHRRSGVACGTVRLILPTVTSPGPSSTFYDVCDPDGRFPVESTAEVSRFSTSKHFRIRCESYPDTQSLMTATPILPHITLSLIAFVIQEATYTEMTHLCAIMKPALLRLLNRFGIHFMPIGPLINYHGWRQPCYVSMNKVLADIAREQPRIWDIVTDRGRIFEAGPQFQVA